MVMKWCSTLCVHGGEVGCVLVWKLGAIGGQISGALGYPSSPKAVPKHTVEGASGRRGTKPRRATRAAAAQVHMTSNRN